MEKLPFCVNGSLYDTEILFPESFLADAVPGICPAETGKPLVLLNHVLDVGEAEGFHMTVEEDDVRLGHMTVEHPVFAGVSRRRAKHIAVSSGGFHHRGQRMTAFPEEDAAGGTLDLGEFVVVCIVGVPLIKLLMKNEKFEELVLDI